MLLEAQELHHEGAGVLAFLGIVTENAQVVNDDDGGAHLKGCFLDVRQDLVFPVFEFHPSGNERSPEEIVGEAVELAGFLVGVAVLKLLGREFGVEVKNAVPFGNLFGYLDGEEGFAEVGIGKEAGDFALVPELCRKGAPGRAPWRRPRGCH